MRVCVIGAGPSGLTTIKQLQDEGHEVTCFEKNDGIGGIWYRSGNDDDQMKAYDNLMLTISMKLMSFSDFMHKGDRTFTDHKGYLKYLESYAETFKLKDAICFNSMVKDIAHEDDDSWSLLVTDEHGDTKPYSFDAIAVCSGPFKTPNKKIAQIEGFKGEVVHSSQYRNNKEFKDKKVLVIGLAESGADLLREISNVTKECTLAIRSHTFLIPRLIYGEYATDTLTSRSHHYEMWSRASKINTPLKAFSQDHWLLRKIFLTTVNIYGLLSMPLVAISKLFKGSKIEKPLKPMNNMGQPQHPSKIDMYTENSKENMDFINDWNRKSHNGEGNWSQKIIFSKNVSFVSNIVNKKLSVDDSGIDYAEGNTVHFKNSMAKDFDVIVLCTGFIKDYSLFKDIKVKDNNIRNLYKHAFHPDYNGRLAMIGYVRPISGGIPICSEMQARYFAQLCSNKLQLPSNLQERIEEEKKWEEDWMCLSPNHNESFPSQIMFLDSIAKEIGCYVPFSKLIFKPRLLIKLWFYSFNQSCYRLTGPHSMHDESMKDIMTENVPLHDNIFMLMMIVLSMMPSSVHPKNIDFKFINND
jgi:dimethylaniline monooxygenase (N-oxide forming)